MTLSKTKNHLPMSILSKQSPSHPCSSDKPINMAIYADSFFGSIHYKNRSESSSEGVEMPVPPSQFGECRALRTSR